MLRDLVGEVVSARAMGAVAVTAATDGSAIDMSNAKVSTAATLVVGTVAGTASPTLNIEIQESSDQTNYTTIPGMTFTAVTAANQYQVVRGLRTKRYVRASVTAVTGTNPSFTLAVVVYGQSQYSGSGGGYSRAPST